MTKPFDACSLADLAHELQLAARDASGSALSADIVARITPCLLDNTHIKAFLKQHPRCFVLGSLVCSSAADSKQAWCSMLRHLFHSAGGSVSDAALLRVYLVVKECAKLGRVRLPQAATPVAVVQFNMRSGGGFEKRCAYGQGQSKFKSKTGDGDNCVLNSVCARMKGGSLESLRLLDYQQNRQWPAHAVEIVSGRWRLQMFAALEQLHGARVFLRVCSAQGAALVRLQLAPAAQRLRLRTLVPVYEMTMGHRERLRGMGCGGRGKLALLMSQGGRGGRAVVSRDCSAMMDWIVRRVAAGQDAAINEDLLARAQAFRAAGECAAAAALLQQAIGLGRAPSRADLADMLIEGREGVAVDHKRAFELVEEGARLGCHHCDGVMAWCYKGGHGCSRDVARSLALARSSAAKGSKYGQRVLGRFYQEGVGVDWRVIAKTEAGEQYRLAAAQGYEAAVAQYRLAAAQGYDAAQNDLGCMYHKGHGVAQDYAEALRWYKLAAAHGFGEALYWVGRCHEKGWSVAADKAEAIRWYKRAAAAGHSEAAAALTRLGA